jgi:hypothetical protein
MACVYKINGGAVTAAIDLLMRVVFRLLSQQAIDTAINLMLSYLRGWNAQRAMPATDAEIILWERYVKHALGMYSSYRFMLLLGCHIPRHSNCK